MHLILKYFPDLDQTQREQFQQLMTILPRLNQQVNVISRKDIGSLEEKHILHSLSIARKFSFNRESSVMDVGTGGGFPGIPLAIMFPEAHFTLVDSIGKKIRLVRELTASLELKNVVVVRGRMESLEQSVDYVVSRAVTHLQQLYRWTDHLIRPGHPSGMPAGLIALKGGNLTGELQSLEGRAEIYPISTWFSEPFFSSKKIVFLKK
jgi:16S rRNA (guanine527-N7)-methyltransferase